MSVAVVYILDFFAGIVVFLSINLCASHHSTSTARERGVTSIKSISFTSHCIIHPWIAAPCATDSSGFTVDFGSLSNMSFTIFLIAGILVEPHTNMISLISHLSNLLSFSA